MIKVAQLAADRLRDGTARQDSAARREQSRARKRALADVLSPRCTAKLAPPAERLRPRGLQAERLSSAPPTSSCTTTTHRPPLFPARGDSAGSCAPRLGGAASGAPRARGDSEQWHRPGRARLLSARRRTMCTRTRQTAAHRPHLASAEPPTCRRAGEAGRPRGDGAQLRRAARPAAPAPPGPAVRAARAGRAQRRGQRGAQFPAGPASPRPAWCRPLSHVAKNGHLRRTTRARVSLPRMTRCERDSLPGRRDLKGQAHRRQTGAGVGCGKQRRSRHSFSGGV